jgi:hypothetical protein
VAPKAALKPVEQISGAAVAFAAAAVLTLVPAGDAFAAASGGRVSNTSGFAARRQATRLV